MKKSGDAVTECVPNIGPLQRRQRIDIGAVLLAASVAGAVVLFGVGGSRLWRLALFFPLLGTALCFFQVREKTCVALAAKGVLNLDEGEKQVTDGKALEAMRKQSQRVWLHSVLVAGAATALFFGAP